MTTGARLTALMEEEGVGVRELHRRTGVSITTIRKLRAGHLEGNLLTWTLVSRALGVRVGYFIEDGEDGKEDAE